MISLDEEAQELRSQAAELLARAEERGKPVSAAADEEIMTLLSKAHELESLARAAHKHGGESALARKAHSCP
jgi:hypothetical protein